LYSVRLAKNGHVQLHSAYDHAAVVTPLVPSRHKKKVEQLDHWRVLKALHAKKQFSLSAT
jgi:hypothetical protein